MICAKNVYEHRHILSIKTISLEDCIIVQLTNYVLL